MILLHLVWGRITPNDFCFICVVLIDYLTLSFIAVTTGLDASISCVCQCFRVRAGGGILEYLAVHELVSLGRPYLHTWHISRKFLPFLRWSYGATFSFSGMYSKYQILGHLDQKQLF